MAKNKRIHVVPHQEGWAIKKEGASRASKVTETKKEAENAGREQAKKENGELIIHGKDGKIQDSDSFGKDPFPPKDTKH